MQYPVIDPLKTGQKLKKLMEQNNITVLQLQEYLGLACPQTIYRWFSGQSMPSIDHLYSMSRYFGTTIDELIC